MMMLIMMTMMYPLFIVNGGWSTWSGLSRCSRPCGGERQYRSRLCSNPFPRHGGRSCVGVRSFSYSCNTHCCPGALTHKKKKSSDISVLTRDKKTLDVSLFYPYCDQYKEGLTVQNMLSDLRLSSNLISELLTVIHSLRSEYYMIQQSKMAGVNSRRKIDFE